ADSLCQCVAIAVLRGIPINPVSESTQSRSSGSTQNVCENVVPAIPTRRPAPRERPHSLRQGLLQYEIPKSCIGSLYFDNFSEQYVAWPFRRGSRFHVPHAEPCKIDYGQSTTENEKCISRKAQPFEQGVGTI